ncbi:MAG: hypothetical protein HY716_15150 [Planctomycetes bacterium]|nr:hypothetical protein [Planctomycetota bacterium]
MAEVLVALLAALPAQDSFEEDVLDILRRLEGGSIAASEAADQLTGLGVSAARAIDAHLRMEMERSGSGLIGPLALALSRLDPRSAHAAIALLVHEERLSPEDRLGLAQLLRDLNDRETWIAEVERVALDASVAPEARARAATLLEETGDSRALEVANRVDMMLFELDTAESARALAARLNGEKTPERRQRRIDYLVRMKSPAARAALWSLLTNADAEPEVRLGIAERLSAAGALERAADARASLAQIRAERRDLAERAERLLDALRGVREEPRILLVAEPAAPPPNPSKARPHAAEEAPRAGLSPARINLILGAATFVLVAAVLALRARSR